MESTEQRKIPARAGLANPWLPVHSVFVGQAPNVCFGSRADSTVTVSICPLLGLKRTESAEKRTLRSKVCFPPESGSRQAGARTSAPSHKRTLVIRPISRCP